MIKIRGPLAQPIPQQQPLLPSSLRDLRVKTDARQTLATQLDSVDFRVIPWPHDTITFRSARRPVWRLRRRVNITGVLKDLQPLRVGDSEGWDA